MGKLILSIVNLFILSTFIFSAYMEASSDFLFGPFPFVFLLLNGFYLAVYKMKKPTTND